MQFGIVGHRGLPCRFPDNSLAGILAAREFCFMVETDVRCTRDRVPVMCHDADFAGHPVHQHTWAELQPLQVGGHPLLRLDELLAAGPLPLNLELKMHVGDFDWRPDDDFARAVATQARPGDLLTSFHWPTMHTLRQQFPTLPTGLIVEHRMSLPNAFTATQHHGHCALALDNRLLGSDPLPILSPLLTAGLRLSVWTVNDPVRAQLLLSLGVSPITDNAPLLIETNLQPAA